MALSPHTLPRRAAILFGALLVAPFPLDRLPWIGARVETASSWLWDHLVPPFAQYVLRLPDVARDPTTGSGDTLFDVSRMALLVALAAIGAIAWSLVDRAPAPSHDAKLCEWLRVGLRYRLAFVMLGYGLAKVFNTQFPMPKASQLLVSYGESSPEGLLWRFMGASTAYTFFAGALECLGAVLLFTRRTTTLGALLLAAVLTNVLMLNLCYDVPVKLYSAFYLGIALFLAGPDLGRLATLLVLHGPVAGRPIAPHFASAGARRTALALKIVFLIVTVFASVRSAYFAWSPTHGETLGPAIRGTYEVVSMTVAGEDEPAPGSRVVLQRGYFALRRADGTKTSFTFALDLATARLVGEDTNVLRYRGDGAPDLALEGTIGNVSYALTLRRLPQPMLERGFHWVTDRPFYR
jgi:hypothetical protein